METVDYNGLENVSFSVYGSDSFIYECDFLGKKYAFKLYEEPEAIFNPDFERKMDILKSMKLSRSVLPSYIVLDKGHKVGFLTEFLKDGGTYKIEKPTLVYKSLLSAKDAILELHDNDVVHCDIHSGNFLTRNGPPLLHDFDISQILSYQKSGFNMDNCSYAAYKFVSKNGVVKNLDIFLFNLLTFCELNGYFRNKSLRGAYEAASMFISDDCFGIFNTPETKCICRGIVSLYADDFLIDHVDLAHVKKYAPIVWKNRY